MQSPRRLRSSEPKEETILVTYDHKIQQVILNVYDRICKEYASVYIITHPTEKEAYEGKRNSLLTKRAVRYIYMQKFDESLSSSPKYHSGNVNLSLHYCDMGCSRHQLEDKFPTMEILTVSAKEDCSSLYAKATKQLHLDFIWLGACGRLGYSLGEF